MFYGKMDKKSRIYNLKVEVISKVISKVKIFGNIVIFEEKYNFINMKINEVYQGFNIELFNFCFIVIII